MWTLSLLWHVWQGLAMKKKASDTQTLYTALPNFLSKYQFTTLWFGFTCTCTCMNVSFNFKVLAILTAFILQQKVHVLLTLITQSWQYQFPSGISSNFGLQQYVWVPLSHLSHSSSSDSLSPVRQTTQNYRSEWRK